MVSVSRLKNLISMRPLTPPSQAMQTKIIRTDSGIPNSEKVEEENVSVDVFTALANEEADHDIKYRTLSWQKTALLLFGEYVCLAILALAWSWSVLGWVAGFFVTFGLSICTWCKLQSSMSESTS